MTTVELRPVGEDDLAIFFEHQADPEATHRAAFPARDLDAHMAHWHKTMNDATVIARTILADGHVAGNIVSWEEDGTRKVGYWIGWSHWGKGIATAALSRLLGLVTTRPLYAHVAAHNMSSLRVLEKCGFTITGVARQAGVEESVLILDD